jgi:hypothetical protein
MILRASLRNIRCQDGIGSQVVEIVTGHPNCSAVFRLEMVGCVSYSMDDRSFEVHVIWRIPLLSMLRKMSLWKRHAGTSNSTQGSPGEQHVGPMSDQQLAVAIRQFQRFRENYDTR